MNGLGALPFLISSLPFLSWVTGSLSHFLYSLRWFPHFLFCHGLSGESIPCFLVMSSVSSLSLLIHSPSVFLPQSLALLFPSSFDSRCHSFPSILIVFAVCPSLLSNHLLPRSGCSILLTKSSLLLSFSLVCLLVVISFYLSLFFSYFSSFFPCAVNFLSKKKGNSVLL